MRTDVFAVIVGKRRMKLTLGKAGIFTQGWHQPEGGKTQGHEQVSVFEQAVKSHSYFVEVFDWLCIWFYVVLRYLMQKVVCVMHLTVFTRRYLISISSKNAACGIPAIRTVWKWWDMMLLMCRSFSTA